MNRDSRGRFLPKLRPGSIADMAAWLTPEQAAHVKYMVLMLRAAEVQDEHTRRFDEMLWNNAQHRWFCFCLDAVARQAAGRDLAPDEPTGEDRAHDESWEQGDDGNDAPVQYPRPVHGAVPGV